MCRSSSRTATAMNEKDSTAQLIHRAARSGF